MFQKNDPQDFSHPNRGPMSLYDGAQMGRMLTFLHKSWMGSKTGLFSWYFYTNYTHTQKKMDHREDLMVQKHHIWEISNGYGSFSDGCPLYQKRYPSIKMGLC